MKNVHPNEFAGSGREQIFHIVTSGKENVLICRKERDYARVVNRLALLSLEMSIPIYAYCVMSSHVHILVRTCSEQANSMAVRLLRFILYHLNEKTYGNSLSLKDYRLVAVDSPEMFKTEVIYIIMNPWTAKLVSPFSYRWSSADAYYNDIYAGLHGTPVSSMSVMDRRFIFATKSRIPENWELNNGMVMSRYFVAADEVRSLFLDSYDFFNSLKFYKSGMSPTESLEAERSIIYSDEEISMKMEDYLSGSLMVAKPEEASLNDKMKVARILKSRLGIGVAQISRVTGVSVTILGRIL